MWCALLGRDDGDFKWREFSCFCSNDLPKRRANFRCDRENWEAYYLSTLVFPLRYVEDEYANKYEVVGFLAFDAPTAGVFPGFPDIFDYRDQRDEYHRLLKEQPIFHLGALFADTLGMLLYPFITDILATEKRTDGE